MVAVVASIRLYNVGWGFFLSVLSCRTVLLIFSAREEVIVVFLLT